MNLPNPRRLAALAGAALVLAALARPARADDEMCLGCHAEKGSGAPLVNAGAFHKSVHKDIGCASCHEGREDVPHSKKAPAVSCDGCHADQAAKIRGSDHGKMLAKTRPGAQLCLACHSLPHELRPASDPESAVSRQNIPTMCNRCHQKLDFKRKYGVEPFYSYTGTVHGKAHVAGNMKAAVCIDCHGGHDLNFADNPKSRANKFNIPQTCGRCHQEPLKLYKGSIHGQKAAAHIKDAPVCTDCHGEHNIANHREPGSMVYTGSIVKTCSNCHGSQKLIAKFDMPLDPTKSYLDSYHGVAFTAGNLSAANCASCHNHHDILPPEDPNSSVNPAHLQRTCGACHRRAGELVNLGKVHLAGSPQGEKPQVLPTITAVLRDGGGDGGGNAQNLLHVVRGLYVWLIVATIGGMLFHNLLYHVSKLRYGLDHAHGDELRMSVNERLQHLVLLVSFIGLAYTGFCHTYPESFFARYVFHGASGAAARALAHRVFAVMLIGGAAFHVAWLGASKEGRRELWAMLPKLKDVTDFVAAQRWILLRKGPPPHFDRFNYMEKAEYWALVWGTFVMAVTGGVAWFLKYSLHFLPKWVIDLCLLIHFMEAILACLAILVWHMYWTIFDPEVYPMNWAWITGYIRPKHAREADEEAGHGPHEPAA